MAFCLVGLIACDNASEATEEDGEEEATEESTDAVAEEEAYEEHWQNQYGCNGDMRMMY